MRNNTLRYLTELNRDAKQVYTAVATRQLEGIGINNYSDLDEHEVFLCVVDELHGDTIIRFVDKKNLQMLCYADDRFRLAYKNEKKKVTKEDRDRFLVFCENSLS